MIGKPQSDRRGDYASFPDSEAVTKSTVVARSWRSRFTHWRTAFLVAVIVVSVPLLSLWWVFNVPILQNPDENSHLDYAFSIYSAGRLLNVRQAPSAWNAHARPGLHEGAAWERISHQYTLYLEDFTDFERLRFHPEEKVSADYGTALYYEKLDRNAPRQPSGIPDPGPQDNPWLMTGYPFGFYALLAVWLSIIANFTDSIVSLFFAARVLSVALLPLSLLLAYATLRELRLGQARALALTAMVGFFPLTTFVSASVQPDNLSLALVLVCFYGGLLARRNKARPWVLTASGVAFGALSVTKYHFFLFTLLSVGGMLISEHIFRRKSGAALVRQIAILLWPSVVLLCIQRWIGWGGGMASSPRDPTLGLLTGIKNALVADYSGGAPFVSWWGEFGWMDTPLIIGSLDIQRRITLLLVALTIAIFLLTLVRLGQVIARLIALGRRGRWRWVGRITFSNPIINSYFGFSIFMILLYALTDNYYFAQGRHWFPYILGSFLIPIQYAPQVFTRRRIRTVLSLLMLLGLAAYCAIGSYYSIQAIKKRYYARPPTTTSSAFPPPGNCYAQSAIAKPRV